MQLTDQRFTIHYSRFTAVIGVLGDHAINPLVALGNRQLGENLQGERRGDERRPAGEAADEIVVEAAAVSQALALTGESHAGHQHEIEPRGGNHGTQVRARLPDAPHAGDELRFGILDGVQLEVPASALHPGQHQRLAPRESIGDEVPGFEFAPEARVSHDAARAAVGIEREQPLANGAAQRLTPVRVERVTSLEDLLANFAL